MFLAKSKQLKLSPKKSKLDLVLWLVENYLPQKKDRAPRKELSLDILEARTRNEIQRFTFLRSKSLSPTAANKKFSFTLGSWALPYLKLLKQIGLAK